MNKFEKYSYIIESNYMYVVMPHYKSKFRLGSLFKKLHDEKQIKGFYNDINEILKIIETVAEYEF